MSERWALIGFCQFLKYKGVKKIDCWVVSHTDEDHISGLREILSSGYPVEYLAVAEQMPRDKNWEELEALAEDAGTKVVWLGRGDIWLLETQRLRHCIPVKRRPRLGVSLWTKTRNRWYFFIRRMTLPVSLPEILERRRKRRF